jgi:phenylacetate-CoA ligase
MHGLALVYILRDLPGVAGFKIVQHSLQRVQVQVVAGPGFDLSAQQPVIVAGFQRRLGAGVQVAVELVPAITPEKSGKFRYVQSRVSTWNQSAKSDSCVT